MNLLSLFFSFFSFIALFFGYFAGPLNMFFPADPLDQQRVQARDAKRISDIRMAQSALELYYNDQTRPAYPPSAIPGDALPGAALSPYYIASLPVPPDSTSTLCDAAQNQYRYTAYIDQKKTEICTADPQTCGWYQITFCIENESGGLNAGPHVAEPDGIH